MTVVRICPGVALVDDEVDVDNVQSLAQSLQQVERVGVHTEQEVTEAHTTACLVLLQI